jgi:hypothetical protein
MLLFFSLPYITMGQLKEFQKIKPVQELEIREGLPNFFAKASKGDAIKVAYLGGSITAQDGWRVKSLEWFKQRFPKASFSEINAAIGGTASDFGAFRVGDQVLKYNPDLVFMEFAVNDDGAAEERIVRSMEGIVRQIWQHNPYTDICFIYTTKQTYLKAAPNGQLPETAEVMEKVAGKYQIPTINFGFEVAKLVSNNQLIIRGDSMELNGVKVFSSDGVHPYIETGHVIYQSVIMRSFESMLASTSGKAYKHKLKNPLDANCFDKTQMFDYKAGELSKNWQTFQIKDIPAFKKFDPFLTTFGKASHAGESLTVRFKGTAVGVYDFMGPDAGRVQVEIDGIVKDTVSRFDPWCTYMRMNYFFIDHLEAKNHVVIFRLLSDPFDKAIILAKIGNVMVNPDDYKENNWYVAKILVDGVVLP